MPRGAVVKAYVAVTDQQWFEQLRRLEPDDVNFWRPSGRGFAALQPGDPLLFKLHAPRNAIAGGGFFVEARQMPVYNRLIVLDSEHTETEGSTTRAQPGHDIARTWTERQPS
jgi:hypothetical protein